MNKKLLPIAAIAVASVLGLGACSHSNPKPTTTVTVTTPTAIATTQASASDSTASSSTSTSSASNSTSNSSATGAYHSDAFGSMKWTANDVNTNKQDNRRDNILIDNDAVYTIDTAGTLRKINASDGKAAWSANVDLKPVGVSYASSNLILAMANKNTVLVGGTSTSSGGGLSKDTVALRLTLFDKTNGKVIKTIDVPPTSSLTAIGKDKYFSMIQKDDNKVSYIDENNNLATLTPTDKMSNIRPANSNGNPLAVNSSPDYINGSNWSSKQTIPSTSSSSYPFKPIHYGGNTGKYILGYLEGNNTTAVLVDVNSGKVVWSDDKCDIKLPVDTRAFTVSNSPNDKYSVFSETTTSDGFVHSVMVNNETGQAKCIQPDKNQKVYVLTAVTNDGKFVGYSKEAKLQVTTDWDGNIKTFPLDSSLTDLEKDGQPVAIVGDNLAIFVTKTSISAAPVK